MVHVFPFLLVLKVVSEYASWDCLNGPVYGPKKCMSCLWFACILDEPSTGRSNRVISKGKMCLGCRLRFWIANLQRMYVLCLCKVQNAMEKNQRNYFVCRICRTRWLSSHSFGWLSSNAIRRFVQSDLLLYMLYLHPIQLVFGTEVGIKAQLSLDNIQWSEAFLR